MNFVFFLLDEFILIRKLSNESTKIEQVFIRDIDPSKSIYYRHQKLVR
jgi:hypothetical protein